MSGGEPTGIGAAGEPHGAVRRRRRVPHAKHPCLPIEVPIVRDRRCDVRGFWVVTDGATFNWLGSKPHLTTTARVR